MVAINKSASQIMLFAVLSLGLETIVSAAETSSCNAQTAASKCAHKRSKLDRTGKTRKGKASYYGREFYGKKMASGKPMKPSSNVAASKTLPLGTKAEVTNLETGRSAVVEIQDRGPYKKGRIVDVSPQVAEQLDIKKKGVAPVEVRPLSLPPKEDSMESNTKNNSK